MSAERDEIASIKRRIATLERNQKTFMSLLEQMDQKYNQLNVLTESILVAMNRLLQEAKKHIEEKTKPDAYR
jgi:uncharacterized protein YsxB (DUF464 family)